MSDSAASDLDTAGPPRASGLEKVALAAAKLLVTGACFWYVSRQIDFSQTLSALTLLDFRWAAFAVLLVMLQIPLVALRWGNILDGLAVRGEQITRAALINVTAISVFFIQVLPSLMGEGLRAWFLVRLGCDWRNAVASVVIDRGVGVGLLIALGFGILLLPSGLTALGGYRNFVLIGYGALLLIGFFVLLLAPRIVPLLARRQYFRWITMLAADMNRIVLGPRSIVILGLGCLIHAMTIVVVWSVGQAQGFALPFSDAAVLFTVMIGVAIVPISIGGWGLRELAVITLLARHGIGPEQALLFSVCFGLTLAAGSLPGALAWLLYSATPSRRSVKRGA